MRETITKRSRPQGAAKPATRASRSKTNSSPRSGSHPSRRAVASSPKGIKSSGSKKAVATKGPAPKKAEAGRKKPNSLKVKARHLTPAPKSKSKPKVTFKAQGKHRYRAEPTAKSKSKPKVTFKGGSSALRGKTPVKTQSKPGSQKEPAKRVVSPPPPPVPPRRQVASAVLRAFEHAVKVFNRRQFAEAKPLFESLQHRYPQEVEINARAQTYIHVCDQKLARPPSSPRDADELYDRGVVALNIGDFTQARSFFEKALRLRPDAPHVLYSLAVTHAQSGAHDQALDYLNRSIQMQPRFRTQALNDADFSGLREDKRFLELLGLTSPFDLLELRR